MKKIIFLFTISVMVLAACGTTQDSAPDTTEETNETTGSGDNKDSESSDQAKQELIDNLKEEEGEALTGTLELKNNDFIFTVENNQEADAEIFFSSGKEYDYVVYDKDGKALKRLSEDMMYTQATKEVILPPGDALTYTASYGEVTSGLSKGEYTIAFIFADKNFHAAAKQVFHVD